eukprot:364027-Chlamydomonas_euryale.AAC.6
MNPAANAHKRQCTQPPMHTTAVAPSHQCTPPPKHPISEAPYRQCTQPPMHPTTNDTTTKAPNQRGTHPFAHAHKNPSAVDTRTIHTDPPVHPYAQSVTVSVTLALPDASTSTSSAARSEPLQRPPRGTPRPGST